MISDRPDGHALLVTLGKNWWMVGARGGLAILFGALLLLRPATSLNLLVVLFGVYALLDGAWAIASALWVTRTWFAAWPVLFEGAVSVAVGGLALAWPLVPRELVLARQQARADEPPEPRLPRVGWVPVNLARLEIAA